MSSESNPDARISFKVSALVLLFIVLESSSMHLWVMQAFEVEYPSFWLSLSFGAQLVAVHEIEHVLTW